MPLRTQRRDRMVRRLSIVVLLLVITLGAVNAFGPRWETASARAEGVTLEVTYAAVTRGGLATRWIVEVRRPGGFAEPIEIATTTSYFDGFDFNQLYPEPSETFNRGGLVVMTFDPPDGDVLRVLFDGRATPTWTFGRSATTALGGEGLPELSVDYRTLVMP